MAGFDDIDRKLLELLQADDRQSLAELSKAIGAAPSTLNDRIRRLQKNGVITGFHARLSPEAMRLDLLAFVLVGWSDPEVEARFLERVNASPDVLECHHVTGLWNYLVKVRVKNTREFESFLSRVIKATEGVQRTETIIALSSTKETWSLPVPD